MTSRKRLTSSFRASGALLSRSLASGLLALAFVLAVGCGRTSLDLPLTGGADGSAIVCGVDRCG